MILGQLDTMQLVELVLEDLSKQKKNRTEGLVLGRRADAKITREVRQKVAHLWFAEHGGIAP